MDRRILMELDDRALLSLCRMNRRVKESCNDEFFQNRIQKYHPGLVKPERLSWKNFYLTMVIWIGRLEEDYDYIYQDKDGDPKKKYEQLERGREEGQMALQRQGDFLNKDIRQKIGLMTRNK